MLKKRFTKCQLPPWFVEIAPSTPIHNLTILTDVIHVHVHPLYLPSCRIVVYKNGIRTTEFFRDHDKLRSGVITENQVRSCGTNVVVYSFVVRDFSWWGRKETHNTAKLNKVWFLHVCFTQVSPYPGALSAKLSFPLWSMVSACVFLLTLEWCGWE